jgi:hypothetical protein
LCKQCQNGRVSENLTSVTFDFSEGWFRDSGLYDVSEQYQLKLFRQCFGFNEKTSKRANGKKIRPDGIYDTNLKY